MITIDKAREILGKKAEKMTDEEVLRIVNDLYQLADIALQAYKSEGAKSEKSMLK